MLVDTRLTRTLVVVVAVVLLALLASGASASGNASGGTSQTPRFVWGAWIGDQFTGSDAPWSWDAVTQFEAKNTGGRHVNAVHWGVWTPWQHEFNYWLGPFNAVRNAGALSVVDVVTGHAPLRKVAKGVFDPSLRRWAAEAAAWGYPFLLRFDFEMNGQWYPWGTRPRNGNTPADFVRAWRHVHHIFTAAGATNAQWVWCPNIDPYHEMTSLARLYPGPSFVDWTCLDGYNFGKSWMSFTKIYQSTYRQILHIAPTKPMIVGEVASTGRGGSKARWIRGMFHALDTHFRRIRGLLWWDQFGMQGTRRLDWPIETSRAASAAFRRGIGSTLAKRCRGLAGAARAVCVGHATESPSAHG